MPKILLVEDDPLAQEIASSILESRGIQVDVASDGFDALRLLREKSYDIALVDYHLPEMDGFALARLIRDLSKVRKTQLRLIGVTADRHGLAARHGAGSLFDAIVAKPFDPVELLNLVAVEAQPDTRHDGTMDVAPAGDPGIAGARLAAMSFWRTRGLAGLPRAAVLPTPTSHELLALQICFDIVDPTQAELLLVLDARGLQQLVRSRLSAAPTGLPVVALDPTLASFSDACFLVADRDSWSSVADLLKTGQA